MKQNDAVRTDESSEVVFVSDPADGYVSEDGAYFKGLFMETFMSSAEAIKLFGKDFEELHVDPRLVEHLINQRMCPPPFPLGITFDPVSIYEPLEDALLCRQVLDVEDNLDEHICILLEGGDYHEIWSDIYFDTQIVMRHIPTLTTETGERLYHAQHLWRFAEVILSVPKNALIFGLVPTHISPELQRLIDEVSTTNSTPRSEVESL